MISINYPGGAHGNFLNKLCNFAYGNVPFDINESTTSNGTFHKNLGSIDKFFRFAYWRANLPDQSALFLEIPPCSSSIISIRANSTLAKALCRVYWRRINDVFCLSPSNLVGMTNSDIQNALANTLYPQIFSELIELKFAQIRAIANDNVLRISSNCASMSKLEVIKFWLSPFNGCITNIDYCVRMSNVWEPSHAHTPECLVDMISLYDLDTGLDEIKKIGKHFDLLQLVSDEDITLRLRSLPLAIQEFPHLATVRNKFAAYSNGTDGDLDLGINDMLVLLQMISIEDNISPGFADTWRKLPATMSELRHLMLRTNSS